MKFNQRSLKLKGPRIGDVSFEDVKFIVVGNPRKFKTTIANKSFSDVFETDGLKAESFDLSDFDLTKQAIIIGGKFYKSLWKKFLIIYKLKQQLNKSYIIWFI